MIYVNIYCIGILDMYRNIRYVPTYQVCTNILGMYRNIRYVPTYQVCTGILGMQRHTRYVPEYQVCTGILGKISYKCMDQKQEWFNKSINLRRVFLNRPGSSFVTVNCVLGIAPYGNIFFSKKRRNTNSKHFWPISAIK